MMRRCFVCAAGLLLTLGYVSADAAAKARNVILFVGDGMGIATVTATRILDGQRRGGSGEENVLSFERFPYTAFEDYTLDYQVSESAGTITAMMSGQKTTAPFSRPSVRRTNAAPLLQALRRCSKGGNRTITRWLRLLASPTLRRNCRRSRLKSTCRRRRSASSRLPRHCATVGEFSSPVST